MPAFIHHGRVAFHETDAAGIAHFSTYFLYAEEAETAALASLGIFSASSLRAYGFPRVQASAQYSNPLRFHDAYTVHASLLHIGNSSLSWRFDIACGEAACARVELVSARRHAADGSAAPYTEAEKAALRTLMQPAPGPDSAAS